MPIQIPPRNFPALLQTLELPKEISAHFGLFEASEELPRAGLWQLHPLVLPFPTPALPSIYFFIFPFHKNNEAEITS